jgi:DNA-binding response OmpR family regulator
VSSKPVPRIFIVDDEPIIASALATIFNMNGYSARCFTRPTDALIAAQSDIPDLLISDVAMPELSGVDLAIQIKARHPRCKILLFSGSAATQDLLENACNRGHDFHLLSKPVHPKELLAELGTLRDRKDPIEAAKMTIADVEQGMQLPGSTESIRSDRRYQVTSTAEKAAGAGEFSIA